MIKFKISNFMISKTKLLTKKDVGSNDKLSLLNSKTWIDFKNKYDPRLFQDEIINKSSLIKV